MPSNPRRGKPVYVELPPDVVERMQALCERNRRSFRDEVLDAVTRHLETPTVVTITRPPLPPKEVEVAEPAEPKRKRGRPRKGAGESP